MNFPLIAFLVFTLPAFAAESLRALPPGEFPNDSRLGPLKELDGYFPFTPPASREAWATRADQVRMQVRVALGLFPEPTKTPLNAVVHDRVEREDYTVEKVFFESMPGLFVTGTLFRPRTTGRHPGVLVAHGHWRNARFAIRTDEEMKKELESGGEVLLEGGRSIFQAIGVQLARMGVVALVYDMLGDSDSQQISHAIAHRFKTQRPEMNTTENWGLFSPQAEAHAQSIMGLQTWNSMRALDFLTALPDVDPQRLGCTGASGGGTQTMMLAALDPRLAVAIPCVMPSTAMQGGCTCENASLLRVGTGNIEIAALFAPTPQAMTTAKDWTIELPTKGFPELQQLYALVGAEENVALWPMPHFPHNYNSVTRGKIYEWLNTHFRLGLPAERLVEREYLLMLPSQLTVWDAAHPAPAGGDDFERRLLQWWHEDAQAQLAKMDSPRALGSAWQTIVGETKDQTVLAIDESIRKFDVSAAGKNFRALVTVLRAEDGSRALPVVKILPPSPEQREVLWLDARGKAGLFNAAGEVRPEVAQLLDSGASVLGIDLFCQGEFQPDGQPLAQTRRTKNPREAACFTFGYNPALFAQRVHDICAAFLNREAPHARQRSIVALDATGPLAAVALAVGGGKVDSAVVQTGGFRFGHVLNLRSPNFLPAAAKYGDLPGALKLARGNVGRLLVLGEGEPADADPVAWLLEKKGAQ